MIGLGFTLAIGFSVASNAAIVAGPADTGSAIVTVGEGCGAGFWRGPGGHCNHFEGPGGNARGTAYECPNGFHFGAGRCQYNR